MNHSNTGTLGSRAGQPLILPSSVQYCSTRRSVNVAIVSAACMAAHHVEARLCRWLLRARDLSGSDTLQFTQEFLAEMLGVRRTSVTTVAHTLQRAGMLKYARGKIQILELAALRETACECYETVNSNYQAFLGGTP